MKKLILILALVLAYTPFAYCDVGYTPPAEEKEKAEESICPFTKISDNDRCLGCHQIRKNENGYVWDIKEEEWRNAPFGLKFIKDGGVDCAYYLVESISADRIFDIYNYCDKNDITKVILEINSPGGSVIEAWRIIGIMQSYPRIKTITKCMGMAASAGFVLLSSGDYRICSPRSMLMAHELWTLSFLKIETPAGSKDEAEIMALWQNNINEWLAEHSKMTAEEVAKKIHKKDWWMIGKEALELGFVDELIW